MKKRSGEVQQFLVQMIGIVFSFAIMLYGIYYSKTIITYNNANQVARKYILKMESKGCLSDFIISDLKSDMEKIGTTVVMVKQYANGNAISGNSVTHDEVKYGDEIKLEIKLNEKMNTIDFKNFSLATKEEVVEFTITKSSTAKH